MSAVYDKGREAFLAGDLDWAVDTIKVQLVTSGYTFSAAHQFLSSIVVGSNGVGTAQTLTGKTVTSGVADADDVTFTAVTGSAVVAAVFYKDTGVAGTSPLIAYVNSGTNLPITPNGGDIELRFDSGANKIFKL
jgi:hypothetical protein